MCYQQNTKLTRQEHRKIFIRESCVAMTTRKLLRHKSLSKNVSRTIKENAYVDILPERVNGFLRVKKVVPCWQLKLSFQIIILVTIVNAELLRTSKALRFATLNMLMKYKNGILSAPLHQFICYQVLSAEWFSRRVAIWACVTGLWLNQCALKDLLSVPPISNTRLK